MRFLVHCLLDKGEQSIVSIQPTLKTDLNSLKGAHILLVEDYQANQRLVTQLLERKGVQVTTADNGQIAIDLLLKQSYDCILMDMQMPVMDGLEATRQIRANPALAGARIIAMTANASKEDWQHCHEAGMNDFITKPLNIDHMYATLAKVLDTPA